MLSVDEIEAMRLFADAKSHVNSNRLKAASAEKTIRVVIEGHPCDITVGFTTRREFGKVDCTASAYVFDSVGNGFFGSVYQHVTTESEAPAVLHAVIEQAIKAAKANPQFQTLTAKK